LPAGTSTDAIVPPPGCCEDLAAGVMGIAEPYRRNWLETLRPKLTWF
jgi:hypothetical protein